MKAVPNTTRRFEAVTALRDETRRVAGHVVACALAARRLGATAESYRLSAAELERQAERAEKLLFARAAETFRAAAAEHRLIAEAL